MFQNGEQVGAFRKFDERLTCFLLGRRNLANAQRVGRYTAASEFWSERWDRMLDLVENGAAVWPQDDGAPHTAESLAALDHEAERQLTIRHAMDDRWQKESG